MTENCEFEKNCFSSNYRISRCPVSPTVLYPPPKIHVHLFAASLQAFYSFTSTEQICSARHERHFHTWHECSIMHLKEHMTSNSTEIHNIRHSPVFHT